MAELITVVFSVAAGLVLAGILTSAVEMFTAKRAGFGLLFSGGGAGATIAVTVFLIISGPLLVARFWRPLYQSRERAAMSLAAAGCVTWSFVTGVIALSIYMHII